jgi:hypothetical protein
MPDYREDWDAPAPDDPVEDQVTGYLREVGWTSPEQFDMESNARATNQSGPRKGSA